jgi:hypothetical protein
LTGLAVSYAGFLYFCTIGLYIKRIFAFSVWVEVKNYMEIYRHSSVCNYSMCLIKSISRCFQLTTGTTLLLPFLNVGLDYWICHCNDVGSCTEENTGCS